MCQIMLFILACMMMVSRRVLQACVATVVATTSASLATAGDAPSIIFILSDDCKSVLTFLLAHSVSGVSIMCRCQCHTIEIAASKCRQSSVN